MEPEEDEIEEQANPDEEDEDPELYDDEPDPDRFYDEVVCGDREKPWWWPSRH